MLDQQYDAGHAANSAESRTALYRRPMPGGGFVEVELESPRESPDAAARICGRVILERRAEQNRRIGHQAPVVAELSGDDDDEVMADLFRLARDNAALARSLMRWQSMRANAD